MNKIFKVKRNANGQATVCSEIATSRSKGRVIASALAIAIATSATSAQAVDFVKQKDAVSTVDELAQATMKSFEALAAQTGEQIEQLHNNAQAIQHYAEYATAVAETNKDVIEELEESIGDTYVQIDNLRTATIKSFESLAEETKNEVAQLHENAKTIQHYAEYATAVAETNKDAIEDLTAGLEETTVELNGKIATNTQGIIDLAQATQQEVDQLHANAQALQAWTEYATLTAETNKDAIASLEAEVEETSLQLSQDINDLRTETAEAFGIVDNEIATNKEQMLDLFVATTNYIDEVDESVGALWTETEAAFENVDNAISDLTAGLEETTVELNDKIATNTNDIVETVNYVNAVAEVADKNSANIEGLTTKVDKLAEDAVTDYNTLVEYDDKLAVDLTELRNEAGDAFEGIRSELDDLYAADEELIKIQKAISDDVIKISDDVQLHEKDIVGLTGDVAKNKAAIDANKADIATNKVAVNANKNEIASNKAATGVNKADIATNKVAIDANKTEIAKKADKKYVDDNFVLKANAADLTAANARLTTVETNYGALDTRVTALDNSYRNLDTKVGKMDKDLSAGIAGAVALSMMPAPTAGAHYVTGGTGIYNGEKALAIGLAGASETGKYSYKVGGSFNSSGSKSVGAGFGYRWK